MHFKSLRGNYHKTIVFLKENKRISLTLFSLAIFSALFYFIYYEGVLEDNVEFVSYEFGNKNTNYSIPFGDYLMVISFESKGAFIAGRMIHVSIDFSLFNYSPPELRESELTVVFPGGLPYPLPESMMRLNDAKVMLHFTGDRSAHGDTELVYLMPELPVRESHLLPFQNNGKYSYNLLINGIPQSSDKIYRKNAFLYIAPLETELQLKNNNLILILTLFAVYLTILQIYISTKK